MSREPTRRLALRGTVQRRHEADALVTRPGDVVVVHRERARSVVIGCPDGCGERLTVNLDPNLGPPWRLYQTRNGLSLFPSVWRESGCGSHFIVWNDVVLWCDRWEADNREPPADAGQADLARRVAARLSAQPRAYAAIAADLAEIPWDVLRACRELARTGRAREGVGQQRGWFSAVTISRSA